MAQRPGIFPTFFISGFECSTFLWKDKGRRNLIAETQHDRHTQEDYNILRSLYSSSTLQGIMLMFSTYPKTYPFDAVKVQMIAEFCEEKD